MAGTAPWWHQGQLNLPCGQISNATGGLVVTLGDPAIPPQDCGFPDGLQPPQALRQRGRAPILTLSPIPRWRLSQRSQAGKLRHAAGSGVLHLLHCEPTLRLWPWGGSIRPVPGPNKSFQMSPAASGVWVPARDTQWVHAGHMRLGSWVLPHCSAPLGKPSPVIGVPMPPHRIWPLAELSGPTSRGQEAPGTGDRQREEWPPHCGGATASTHPQLIEFHAKDSPKPHRTQPSLVPSPAEASGHCQRQLPPWPAPPMLPPSTQVPLGRLIPAPGAGSTDQGHATVLSCLEATSPCSTTRRSSYGEMTFIAEEPTHTKLCSRLRYSEPGSPSFSSSLGTRAPTTACSSAWKGHCRLGRRRLRCPLRRRHTAKPRASTLPTRAAATTALPSRASPASSSFFTVRHGAGGTTGSGVAWAPRTEMSLQGFPVLGVPAPTRWGTSGTRWLGWFGAMGRSSGLAAHLHTMAPGPAPEVGQPSPGGASPLLGTLRVDTAHAAPLWSQDTQSHRAAMGPQGRCLPGCCPGGVSPGGHLVSQQSHRALWEGSSALCHLGGKDRAGGPCVPSTHPRPMWCHVLCPFGSWPPQRGLCA